MRVFLAGASGVIGSRLIPLLLIDGHTVAGLTRTEAKAAWLAELGAEPVVCDVYDTDALTDAVVRFEPGVVIHELTDLPDDPAKIAAFRERHTRIRIEGTHNLIAAARAASTPRLLAQSVAWPMPDGPGQAAVAELERSVLAYGGVVLRYGQFYGPGTFHPTTPPGKPQVHIQRAAEETAAALHEPSGILVITDDGTTRLDAAPGAAKED
ncbi:NAD-dependent epimerase/dehydratase family protein [Microbacterium sp. SYP-A9085]|jgi:nucleoside-diphosphate-sugar epimerase|uniref:NAD-dependent epimerase/dehydratase family protein n=1 Tax=Microbacterium sp. SYP-A9085 TaxID=2664454 RepID=UPI00129A831F|nr:NAD(P)-dependent oxidoreductase [Microbacterium sp. SYP-A9085]MRH28402.1 NAD-dependent epimerase/dehydratase family protein [Microbacterium sp. SYP-A9085]